MLQIASKTYGSHPDGPDGDDNQRIEAKHPSLANDTGNKYIRTVVEPLQQAGTNHPKVATERGALSSIKKEKVY